MKKLKLLLGMLAMTALLAGTVVLFSPYAPVVAPVAEIEEIWAIEDARVESDVPLVTALENYGVLLGYDAPENTFYCTLGLDHGETWPDIHLTAPGAEDVNLVFVDDYTYDWCADAIREGYPYQVMAYTDEAFWYFDVVFTGLPLIHIDCAQEIGDLDTAAQVTVSAYGQQKTVSAANIHLRGGGTRSKEKKNYRIEFTRGEHGKKNRVELPGFGLRENILLNPMVFDDTLLRDRVCWALYADLLGDGYDGAFTARQTGYAEVFLNQEYRGVYLMMEPVDAQEELAKEGGICLQTDGVYRVVRVWFAGERPIRLNPSEDSSGFELRYEPVQAKQFELLDQYVELFAEEDDELFAQKATCLDLESVVRYVLLRQITCMDDNVNNNMYVWARRTDEGMKYTLSPWDMDMSWAGKRDNLGEEFECWLAFPMLDRMLACNAGGIVDLMLQRWGEWRQEIFTQAHIEQILQQFMAELENSGALMRNQNRWGMGDFGAVEELSAFGATRIEVLDIAMDMFANRGNGYPAFLTYYDPEIDSAPIVTAGMQTE